MYCAFILGVLLFLVRVYKLLSCLHDMFIPCVIQSFLSSFALLYLTGKQVSNFFRKVFKNELNMLLVFWV